MFYFIQLNSGSEISLKGYFKTCTYETLFEGQLTYEQAVQFYQKNMLLGKKLWPLDPVVDIYGGGDYPVDNPMKNEGPLWRVLTVANFINFTAARDQTKMASALTLAWLEEEPEYFISEPNKKIIEGLDWKSLARDFDW